MIAAGRGQHEQAIRFYQETIALAADNAELTLVAHAGLGEVYLELGAREKARMLFERCLQTIDAARTRLSRTEYKLTFFSRVIEFYQQYVDVLVADGDHVKALEVAESSRALLLSERLQLDGGRRSRVTRAGLHEAAGRMNVVFLSYWLGPDRSFLWVVNRREFKLSRAAAARPHCLARGRLSCVHRNERPRSTHGQLCAGSPAVRHPRGAGAIIRPRRLPRRPRPRRPSACAERGDAAGIRRVPSLFHRGRYRHGGAGPRARDHLDLAASPRHGGAPPRRRSGGGRARLPPAAQRRPRDRRHP